MASKQSTSAELTARRVKVWNLRTQEGLSQAAIAEIVGVSQTTVCRDLDKVAEQVASDLVTVAKREKVIQVHQLQAVVREAFQAWQKSKEPYKEIKKEAVVEKKITVSEKVQSKIVERVGNTVYLRTALEAMTDLRDLLGLEEPKTVNFNWKKELEDVGLDPAQVFESMVQAAFEELENEGAAGDDG